MANRNFPTIAQMSNGYNYVLKHGQPYRFKIKSAGWNNGDRVIAASRVINGESIAVVAKQMNCCVSSIRNWIKTLDTNNPRLEG